MTRRTPAKGMPAVSFDEITNAGSRRTRQTETEHDLVGLKASHDTIKDRMSWVEDKADAMASALSTVKTDVAIMRKDIELLMQSRMWWRSAVPVSMLMAAIAIASRFAECK